MQPIVEVEQDIFDSEVSVGVKIDTLSQLGEISFVVVKNKSDPNHKIWKQMMEERHYLRSGKLFGRQLRYLVHSSEYGWIGGLGFSSASWRLKERDSRICISPSGAKRATDLNQMVCNSRFLILPEYGAPNVASHVLGRCMKRLVGDWERRHGVRLQMVETFVDADRFRGTCYRASNWIYLGETCGRGRNDRHHTVSVSRKMIFAYPLERGVLKPVEKLAEPERDWVEEEFQHARLGNRAKQKRLFTLARDFYEKPRESLPVRCGGRGNLKGAYRFFSDKKVSFEAMLGSHSQQSVERAQSHAVILSVQDTTDLDYATHKATEGLGYLVSSFGKSGNGFVLHDTVLFTTSGLALGVLDGQVWVRPEKDEEKARKRASKPIEEKESYKWLKSFEATERAQQKFPGTRFVSVGDREADIYELFELSQRSRSSFLVRSFQDRTTQEGTKVWEDVEAEPIAGIKTVFVSRAKGGKQETVHLAIRFKALQLKAPNRKQEYGGVGLWAISARERDTPEGRDPLEWKLLTDVETGSFEMACERVDWYAQRFKIEVFHRILKSGCRVEARRLESYESLKRCLAIDRVVAWRIFYLTFLGRETPDIGCDFFLKNLSKRC